MHASEVLQRCLSTALKQMHALRRTAMLLAVDALIAGRRLVLIDLARSWPEAERVRAPLKRLDRLLGNRHLHEARFEVHAAMARWLLRGPHPLIIIDWCRLKADGRWHLLRAAVPVSGRTMTLLDMVFPQCLQSSPRAERQFLKRLAALVPAGMRPILITDAGYRAPWCRAVEARGWFWLTRLRSRTQVKPCDEPNQADQWVSCKTLHELSSSAPRTLGLFDIARYKPLRAQLFVHTKSARGRHHCRLDGRRARSKQSLSAARREREPWILICSPDLSITAAQAVQLYARRMQIEQAFRDLKSHRFGHSFEDSLTRKPKRIEILLLLDTLALFAAWLAGLIANQSGMSERIVPHRAKRRLYSLMRLGWEALARHWLDVPPRAWQDVLNRPPDFVLSNLEVGA